MDKRQERRGLGRGLSALMADVSATREMAETPGVRVDGQSRLPIESLYPNPDQPRRDFSDELLAELAESIREKGVLQPLIVRQRQGREGFEIVAGERRWRAAQAAQLHDVPVVIREYSDTEALEVAIIENIQRADLNPVEEAMAYGQLLERFGHTQERLAEALGKSRSYIANALRLLKLPEQVLVQLRRGELSAGHARALITSDDPAALARRVVAEGLTVRDVEDVVRRKAGSPRKPRSKVGDVTDPDTLALEADLSANLGMSVKIRQEAGGDGGVVTIRFESLDDLDRLCGVLSGGRSD